MKTKKPLSEKIIEIKPFIEEPEFYLKVEDVAEAVSELKVFIMADHFLSSYSRKNMKKRLIEKIDKIFGDFNHSPTSPSIVGRTSVRDNEPEEENVGTRESSGSEICECGFDIKKGWDSYKVCDYCKERSKKFKPKGVGK